MATTAGTGSARPTAASDAARWDQVAALHAHVEHRLATALQRAHGLGLSEYRALAHLVEAQDGELRMQDLAARIGLNQSSVTRLVGRLMAAGFAYRDLCPDDRRGIYTVVTDAGRTRHDQARSTYEQTLTDALDEMARSSGPQAALVSALRTVD
ncbi:MarR family winged helix-turn-helix transcriptional regulator [Micromonospora sp. URMC 106]|uniref:MarR family winged helix-turn-helix transcriptional regulator n=1 Tax=Micromonospora sp. URMC 106 TaxID=3423408 RepID=UPI003F1B9399